MFKHTIRNAIGFLAILLGIVTQGVSAQPLPPPEEPRGARAGLPYALPPGFEAERANVYVVTTTADAAVAACTPGDGLSLREAFFCADQVTRATIYIPSGTYTLTAGTLITSNETLTIVGEDAATTIIRYPGERVFSITPALGLTLANLTIRDSGSLLYEAVVVAGSSPEASVIVYNMIVTENLARSLFFYAIHASVIQSTVSDNPSENSGAITWTGNAAGASLSVSGSVFDGNSTPCNSGAAISMLTTAAYSTLTINDSVFSDNTTVDTGLGCAGSGNVISVNNLSGAEVEIAISGSEFTGNSGGRGGVLITNFLGPSSLVVEDSSFSGNSTDEGGGVFELMSARSVTLLNSTFSGNSAAGDGGVLLATMDDGGTIFIDGSTFANNTTSGCVAGGGALRADFTSAGGTLTVTDSVFTGNSILVSCPSGGGGAISANYATQGQLSVQNSQFTDNSAAGSDGGAVYAYTGTGGTSVVENSTFRNNSADRGGGLYDAYSTVVQIGESLFVDNSATGDGGGAHLGIPGLEIGSLSLSGAKFFQNTAGGEGGGLLAEFSQAYFEDTWFAGNTSGTVGGGFYLELDSPNQLLVNRTTIEDNNAPSDPECRVNVSTIVALGGSTLSQPSEVCAFDAQDGTSRDGNLLLNGGFENPQDTGPRAINENLPANWTPKTLSGDKRKCNTATATVTSEGWCAIEFKGSATENAQLSQTVNLGFTPVNAGDTLLLAATAKASGAPNLSVEVKVTTSLGASKFKVKFNTGTAGAFVEKVSNPLLLAANATAIKATVKNKGASGKVVLGSVWLWIDESAPRMAAPPPSVPVEFRGGS
ncbi:MAG: hypothetical protein IPK52_18845 [Chloroflexi bacterium]|nr:hypothetical protein [Chloroflexota bacterium]